MCPVLTSSRALVPELVARALSTLSLFTHRPQVRIGKPTPWRKLSCSIPTRTLNLACAFQVLYKLLKCPLIGLEIGPPGEVADVDLAA